MKGKGNQSLLFLLGRQTSILGATTHSHYYLVTVSWADFNFSLDSFIENKSFSGDVTSTFDLPFVYTHVGSFRQKNEKSNSYRLTLVNDFFLPTVKDDIFWEG